MLSEPASRSGAGAELTSRSAYSSTLLTAVQALSLELGTVRDEVGPEVLQRLAGAEAELAAIHDELRLQQQEIHDLLAGAGSARAGMMRRFLAMLPLATVLTSSTGKIIEANAAAHAALRIPSGGLAGKPIFAFVAQDDRRRLRTRLSQVVTGDDVLPATALVAPRHGAGVQSHLALVREIDEQPAPDSPVVRWVILPDYEANGGPPSCRQLEALTRLCRLGADDGDLRATLGQLARLCLQAIVEAGDVSLLVGNPLEPTMTIASSATAQHLDGLQHARAGGPSFEAFRSRRPVALDGEAISEHPGLAQDEQGRALRSLLAVPLITDDLPSGVLTVYSAGEPSVATLAALRQVMPFVEAAQALIRDTRAHEEMRRTQEQLTAALTSRAVIDQAKGMIMISLKCNADDAFAHLVRLSGTRHEKVRDVAQSMVDDVLTKRSRLHASPSG